MSKYRCVGKIITIHKNPYVIADAIKPDNTRNMSTVCENESITTEFRLDEIGTLIATVDDYLLNLKIAEEMTEKDAERE
ncbi:MAG: hypothetical protein LRZ87_02040 [Methanocellales archaeon]|nr:hypothetical protein [Methanocellales archaeon]